MASPCKKLPFVLMSLLLFAIHSTNSLRILGLFPLPVKSHFVTCEELMKALAGKGHQVDVYSHFPLKKEVKNYNEFHLNGSLPILSNNLTYENYQLLDRPSKFLLNMVGLQIKDICELLNHPHFKKLRQDQLKNPPYDLIILEYSLSNCFIAWGRYFNIPIIGITTLASMDWINTPLGSPLNLATDSSLFDSHLPLDNFFARLNNVITYYTVTTLYHYICHVNNIHVQKFFGPDYPNIADLVKDFSLILLNHNMATHGVKTFSPSIVPIGGLHIVDHNETLPQIVQKWLDESTHGFIYVSFGSMMRIELFPKPVLEAFYRSFKNIAPIRVLIKIANPEELPSALPSNVISYHWLPQIQVLKHKNIKAFVTHSGLMGTQEAIYYGVPMIGIPLFADQYLNIDLYTEKKIAIKLNLNELTEKKLTDALNDVLNDPIYKKSIVKISRQFKDRPLNPIDTAIYWIEYISRYGKDALKSPIVNMPFWQANLLDVYGFIIFVCVIVLYITIKLVKVLVNVFRSKLYTKSNYTKSKNIRTKKEN